MPYTMHIWILPFWIDTGRYILCSSTLNAQAETPLLSLGKQFILLQLGSVTLLAPFPSIQLWNLSASIHCTRYREKILSQKHLWTQHKPGVPYFANCVFKAFQSNISLRHILKNANLKTHAYHQLYSNFPVSNFLHWHVRMDHARCAAVNPRVLNSNCKLRLLC